MRLLFLGDVVGRAGRIAVAQRLPGLRAALAADFCVVNGENAAGGFGITEAICQELLDAGADVVTTGNHVWDQREALIFIARQPRLLRPVNYPAGTPGKGAGLFITPGGQQVLVVNVMGALFMNPLDNPFAAVERELAACRLGQSADAILIDVHAEATAEKQAIAAIADGRASAIIGTHTHVPTADAQILPGGTAYISDAGMCGDYDSIIGMAKEESVARFVLKTPVPRLDPPNGEATLCGCVIDTDDATGLARRIQPLRLGGRLEEARPEGL